MANRFKLFNNVIGWVIFAIAAFTYCSTIEPTASFWDCGEYIACSYKLEVGHPPGAPTFLILGRVFSLLSGGDPGMVAYWINMMSALASAFTILFLFWSITLLGLKMARGGNGTLTDGKALAILGSGIVGALAYTFSDSFWFSAVEGEVYAMSSFFTAIVFWAILRWDADDSERSDRWLVLIAYLMGLSIGVHLLNLLAIPAIVLIYYFKKYKPSLKGIIVAGVISVALLGIIQNGIIPGVVNCAANSELMFVNSVGLPFNGGTIVYFLLLIGLIVTGIRYANDGTDSKRKLFYTIGGAFFLICILSAFSIGHWGTTSSSIMMRLAMFGLSAWVVYKLRNNLPKLNTILLSLATLLIGYSTFFVLIIRSQANTPMDENNPEDAISMLAYLQRKQYGDWPILYGPYFGAPLDVENPYKDDAPVYEKNEATGKYEIVDYSYNSIPNYAPEMCTLFPRMWEGNQRSHAGEYKEWAGLNAKGAKPRKVKVRNNQGEMQDFEKPSFGNNLKYFFSFQTQWMYMRYFAWNFIGRQNDIQGHGPHHNSTDGGWMSGFNGFEGVKMEKVPDNLLNNKGMNRFYAIPFLLGLLGMWFHFRKDWKNALVVLLLFMLTGLAIIIYLNQYPLQPRERDYAYAGSFYAFAFWIGFAVYAIYELTMKALKEMPAAAMASVVCLIAPFLMVKDGWDDHNRSNRYTGRDFAKDYLASCAPNAILFTNGDNDTFPLWYVQEVEGFRTDVRVVNLSLLNTDWYIEQSVRKAYNSDPVPFSFTRDQYRQGTNDQVFVIDDKKVTGYRSVKEVIDFVKSKDPATKYPIGEQENDEGTKISESLPYIPTKRLFIPVDKKLVKANGTVPADTPDSLIADSVKWTLDKNYMFKADLMILDLLAHNDWKRPIYFAVTAGSDSYLNLEDYFQLEGLAYRLVPYKQPLNRSMFSPASVNTSAMFNNIMDSKKSGWDWGGIDKYDLYLDENNLRMTTNLRIQMMTLADVLIQEKKDDKARQVLDKCMSALPEKNVPYEPTMIYIAQFYYKLGTPADIEKANKLSKRLFDMSEKNIRFFAELEKKGKHGDAGDKDRAQQVLLQLSQMAKQAKQTPLVDDFQKRINALAAEGLYNFGGQQPVEDGPPGE